MGSTINSEETKLCKRARLIFDGSISMIPPLNVNATFQIIVKIHIYETTCFQLTKFLYSCVHSSLTFNKFFFDIYDSRNVHKLTDEKGKLTNDPRPNFEILQMKMLHHMHAFKSVPKLKIIKIRKVVTLSPMF